ncbi:MAG: polyprenyl synthetase family protein [Muribaculaceae bacterium]|nr:polyprenyl synthetase family protein [Muribaculaceae bacterium]
MTFNEKYLKIKQFGQKELDIIQEKMVSIINTKEPLNSYLKDFLTQSSKRIRPLVAILYLKAQGKELTDNQLKVLSAIELVHNASLVHDDIIDESKLRRGHKTLCAEFDNKLAVISGDYLISCTMEILTELNNIEVIKTFINTIKQMCIGEINQNFDRFKIGTIEDYINKTKAKTSYLFDTAIVCCEILDISSFETKKSEFGLNFGTAFQIRDDLLNLAPPNGQKPTNNDIEDGIYNAPVIFAQNTTDLSLGIEKTKVLLNNYIKYAENEIRELPENIYKTALLELLELLNNV